MKPHPPAAALMRRPAGHVRRRLLAALHEAGHTELQPAHLNVFGWPGPHGARPSVLATRARMTKQAMNHLLGQLETAGYIERQQDPSDRRMRLVSLTERGHEALMVAMATFEAIEAEWRALLGDAAYDRMWRGLAAIGVHLDGAE